MMFKKSLMLLALIGAGAIGLSAMPAAAFSVQGPQQGVTDGSSTSLLTKVVDRRVKRDNNRNNNRFWDRRRDGPRCYTRYGNCRHYYRGYYYSSPWWTLPVIGTGIVIGSTFRSGGYYGNRHVQWCLDHYRSYNVRRNTWVSYSGEVRQCISPYR